MAIFTGLQWLARRIVLVVIFTPATVIPASGNEAEVQQCQQLKDRIERYSELRRKGGSGNKMDSWKRQLREAEAEFRDNYCRDYRRRLR